MVSQAVIIGAGSAGGVFVVLCIATLLYCCYRKYFRGKTGGDGKKNFKIAEPRDWKINQPKPPPLDLSTVVMTAPEEKASNADKAYPSLRTSVVLPAVTTGQATSGSRSPRPTRGHAVKRRGSLSSLGNRQGSEIYVSDSDAIDGDASSEQSSSRNLTPNASLSTLPMRKRASMMSEYDPLQERVPEDDVHQLERTLTSVIDHIAIEKEAEAPLGQIYFQLEYKHISNAIRVHLIRATDLLAKDIGGKSDPFVEVMLVDIQNVAVSGRVTHLGTVWKSQTVEKTLDPEFDEFHDFLCPSEVPYQRLGLMLYVYDYDRFSRNEILGHAFLSFNDLDISTNPLMWKALQPGKLLDIEQADVPLGELQIALEYDQSTNAIQCCVRSARNLLKADTSKPPDAFVKARLIFEGNKIGSKDTSPKSNTQCPVFNKQIRFALPPNVDPENCILSLQILHHDRVNNVPLGVVTLGHSLLAGDKATKHWRDMLDEPGVSSSAYHRIQPPMHATTYKKKKKMRLSSVADK